MFDIKDKVVLISGAAGGIGASVVRTFLEDDIKHVTILDVDEKNGSAIEEELNTKYGSNKVKFIKCDVTREQEVLDAFRTVKSEQSYIDVVINNAGIFDETRFVKEIEVNFTAAVRGTLQAWDLMREDNGGSGVTVINVASIAAIGCCPVTPIYNGTKAAVVKFSTTLGDEVYYSRTGVRILTICFGVTHTQMTTNEKLDSFDSVLGGGIREAFDAMNWQTTDNAALGVREVYKNGKTGSVWLVTSGKPALDVTDKYVQGTELFHDVIFD